MMDGQTFYSPILDNSSDPPSFIEEAFTSVQFGYKVSSDPTEPIYLGISFQTELIADKFE